MRSTFNLDKERQKPDSIAHSSIMTTSSAADLQTQNHDGSGATGTSEIPEKREDRESDLEDESQFPHGLKLLIIVAALGMSIFLVALDMTIVATAIPKITDQFHSLDDASWYGSAFLMTTGGFQSTWGKIYKYFPLKISFLGAVFIFEVGSLICGVAPNSVALIVGRAIAGIGAAGIGSGVFIIIAFIASPKRRPFFTGIVGMSYGIASVVGPLVGGAFADKVTWRWCFYINLPVGAVAAAAIIFFFHTPDQASTTKATLKEKLLQIDPIGTILLICTIISYILPLQYGGQTKAWNSSTVIGLLVGFPLMIIAFMLWEWFQGERAAFPPRLMSNRLILVNALYAFLFAGSYFIIVYYLPYYFQSVQNVSPTMSGVRNLPLIVSMSLAIIVSGGSITKTGHTAPLMVVGGVLATIGSGQLYSLDIGSSTGKWIGYQIVGGVGWGLAYQVPINAVHGAVDPSDLATVTGVIVFFQTVGGAVFVAAAQAAFVNQLILKLAATAPNIDSALVVATGASELRDVFSAQQMTAILPAYMTGLKVAYAISIAAAGIAFCLSPFNNFKKIDAHAGGKEGVSDGYVAAAV
ncbi:MFS general substrate transporter [Aspergillus pseudoustus]|uniref:MFS general substrate transporter n=1 Tax=Aspergillus pseudoustus TaxID=1810923 RepID=A0ABR4J422_9EURO